MFMKIRSTARLNIDPKKGSGTIYLKKEFIEKIKMEQKVELLAEFNEEDGVLSIREL
jgi:hypothetical protein